MKISFLCVSKTEKEKAEDSCGNSFFFNNENYRFVSFENKWMSTELTGIFFMTFLTFRIKDLLLLCALEW